MTKLRKEDVLEIRSSDLRQCELARKFDITPQTVGAIIYGERWAQLPGARPRPGKYQSKLTKEQVLEIRASDLSPEELAEKYGVTSTNIRHILYRYTWKHLPGEPKKMRSRSKLTDEQVLEIRSHNLPRKELATKYGVSVTTIGGILNKETYRHLLKAKKRS